MKGIVDAVLACAAVASSRMLAQLNNLEASLCIGVNFLVRTRERVTRRAPSLVTIATNGLALPVISRRGRVVDDGQRGATPARIRP